MPESSSAVWRSFRHTVILVATASCFSLAAVVPSAAQSLTLIREINQVVRPASSYAPSFTVIGSRAYFTVNRGGSFSLDDLWSTDGTPEGTRLVKTSVYGTVAEANGQLYFQSYEPWTGLELWRTDDVPPGFRLVRELQPGDALSEVRELTSSGGKIFFGATAELGPELWKTDGTESGTGMVADIFPGPEGSVPHYLVPLDGGRVVFNATEPVRSYCFRDFWGYVHCGEPWISDGTEAGTTILADLIPGPFPSNPARMFRFGDLGFFTAFFDTETSYYGNVGVWVYDMAAGEVRMLTDRRGEIFQDSFYNFLGFKESPGGVAFVVSPGIAGSRADLVITDGTPDGTRRLSEIAPLPPGETAKGVWPSRDAFFLLSHNHGAGLWSIWYFDGASVRRLIGGLIEINYPTVLGERLLFFDISERMTPALRSVDATGATELLVKADFMTQYAVPVVVNGRMLFTGIRPDIGHEPWTTDGTPGGTFPLMAPADRRLASDPREFTSVGGRLYFTADDGIHGRQLWVTDGSGTGTRMLRHELFKAEEFRSIVDAGGSALILSGSALLESDGHNLRHLATGVGVGTIARTGVGTLAGVFWSNNGDHAGVWIYRNRQLEKIADLPWAPTAFAELHGLTYFVCSSNTTGAGGLWVTDGTREGTRQIVPLSWPQELVSTGDRLYFAALYEGRGVELWMSDGTEEGTTLAVDTIPGPVGVAPYRLRWTGTHLFFQGWPEDSHAPATYAFDGRESVLIKPDNFLGASEPMVDAVHDGAYYWSYYEHDSGFGLWRSDGTMEGTRLVRTLDRRREGPSVNALVSMNGSLYMAGHGLWRIEAAGAVKLLAGGYQDLAAVGSRVVVGGDELYEMHDDAPTLSIDAAVIVEEPHEGERSVSLTLRLSRATLGEAAVSYDTADGTARAGEDYFRRFGTVRFEAGELERAISFPVAADELVEGDETFHVRFYDAAGLRLQRDTTTVVITDPRAPGEDTPPARRVRTVRRP